MATAVPGVGALFAQLTADKSKPSTVKSDDRVRIVVTSSRRVAAFSNPKKTATNVAAGDARSWAWVTLIVMSNYRLLLSVACLGVSVCAACGSSFTGATGGAGGTADAGGPSDGGNGAAAGNASGGASGDTSTNAGGPSAGSGGSTTAGAGGSAGHNAAGAGGTSAGAGGTSGRGGAAGMTSTAGAAGAPATDCKTLEAQYATLVEKARVCDKGSTDECSPSSKLEAVGCGCPTLVNAKAEATTLGQKKYKELQDNKCLGGVACGIACVAVMSAACAPQTMGTGTGFVCTGSLAAN